MPDMFQPKIDDFTGWASLAFDHFENARYADALTNVRKAGEAASKLILIYRYSEKQAEEKISGKTLKELIELLIREGLIQRKTVNWLETLQIYGNVGTHDNRVAEKDARYSIQALEMLTQWLFEECINAAVPSVLEKYFFSGKQIRSEKSGVKPLLDEISTLKKEKKTLEEQLRQTVKDKKQTI